MLKSVLKVAGLAAGLVMAVGNANAAVLTATEIQNGSVVQSIAPSPLALETGDWFVFGANAGDSIDLVATRLEAAPDLLFRLFFGDVRGMQAGPSLPGLDFVTSRDDTIDDAFGGPFADPALQNFLIDQSGIYSLVVGTFSSGQAGQYQLSLSGTTATVAQFENPPVSAVPVPAALPLLATGLAGIGLMGWRKRKTS